MKALDWVDLAMMFNLLQGEKVAVITDKKVKIQPINKLNNIIKCDYKGIRY